MQGNDAQATALLFGRRVLLLGKTVEEECAPLSFKFAVEITTASCCNQSGRVLFGFQQCSGTILIVSSKNQSCSRWTDSNSKCCDINLDCTSTALSQETQQCHT